MNCCLRWGYILWENKELEKLKNAECSEELRKLIDTSFEKKGENYIIKLRENVICPFLTEDRLCSIQKELGEKYLSKTCRIYPRMFWLGGNTIYRYCNISCYRVMDILCNDKDCMALENFEITNKKIEAIKVDAITDTINHPELKYRHELLEFFYEIISDDSHSLETSIVLGAVAAQALTKIINNGEYDKIPDYIKDIKKQLNDTKQIERLEAFKPKPEVRVGFAVNLNKETVNFDLQRFITNDGKISIEKFLEGERKFNEAYTDRPFALRNVALNLLLELCMPFRDNNVSLFENYCYFAAAVSAVKFVASVAAINNDPESGFKIVSAYVSRSFAHNYTMVKPIIELLNKYHCTSPAYLLLILK